MSGQPTSSNSTPVRPETRAATLRGPVAVRYLGIIPGFSGVVRGHGFPVHGRERARLDIPFYGYSHTNHSGFTGSPRTVEGEEVHRGDEDSSDHLPRSSSRRPGRPRGTTNTSTSAAAVAGLDYSAGGRSETEQGVSGCECS